MHLRLIRLSSVNENERIQHLHYMAENWHLEESNWIPCAVEKMHLMPHSAICPRWISLFFGPREQSNSMPFVEWYERQWKGKSYLDLPSESRLFLPMSRGCNKLLYTVMWFKLAELWIADWAVETATFCRPCSQSGSNEVQCADESDPDGS